MLNNFLSLFEQQSIPYTEFSKSIKVLDISDKTGTYAVRSDLDTFVSKNSRGDSRPYRLEQYKQCLYQILVVDRTKTLTTWYNKHGMLPNSIDFYFNIPQKAIVNNKIINGKTNSKYGKIARHLNFDTIYNTKKLSHNDSEYTIGLMLAMFNDYKLRNSMACPAFFDQICKYDGDSSKFWNAFMLGANKPSVFNPQTYKCILDELFEGEILLAPVMGWNSYQTAFYSSKFKHFVSTDVIPSVVNNGKHLHTLQQTDKTIDLYCVPSEQWDLSKYKEQVDSVLFSPPYFDLEIYDSENQSLSNYPNYEEWLKCYWEQTVKNCVSSMKPGAKFGFIISNYVKDKKMNSISQDMRDVVSKYLKLIDHYKIQWSNRSGSRESYKTRNGNFEDLWMFIKDQN